MNDTELEKIIKDAMNDIVVSSVWNDDGLWRGWDYDIDKNRYYFDDFGSESIAELWDELI